MPNLIAYVLHGHDNDSYMLNGVMGLSRCPVCGELLERPLFVREFTLSKKFDVSATYDGYKIVSQRFVDAWQQSEGLGLTFTSLPATAGYYCVNADCEIEFDAKRRKTRFEEKRLCCGKFRSIAGATPAFLKTPEKLNDKQAFRTDLWFGSGDEKHPLIILPIKLGDFLKKAKLSGLDLSEVRA